MKSTMILSLLACLELASAAVFKATTFNDISIAGGVAGNAKEEALAALAGLPADLTTVEKSDLTFLDNVNGVCNDAETGAFNPAIDAATGEEQDAVKVRSDQPLVFPTAICVQEPSRRPKTNRICVTIAWQDQEQGLEAHCHHLEAGGADCAGQGRRH